MYKFPLEVVDLIYEYDGRYKNKFKDVLEEIKTINEWYKFTQTTLICSIPNHYYTIMEFPTEEAEYYREIIRQEFSHYYFRKNNASFLKKLKNGIVPNNLRIDY